MDNLKSDIKYVAGVGEARARLLDKELGIRTVGDRWSYLQRHKFGSNAQPFYVLLTPDGQPLNRSYAYDEDPAKFLEWLREGIERNAQAR